MTIFLIVWGIGYIFAYFMSRWNCLVVCKEWTKGDRMVTLVASVISWPLAFALLMITLSDLADKDKRPAKW
jgi:hypothetical protein